MADVGTPGTEKPETESTSARRAGHGSDQADILHADLDAFYASVEQRDRPELRGRPVIVGEGVVLAASYEARVCGVRSAMPGGEARRRCPQAVVVPTRFSAYAEASKQVFEIFRGASPLVEPLSVDEAFLDVSGARRLLGAPVEIAEMLRTRVRLEVGLPLSVGIARTKYLAKVASSQAKPDGLLRVDPARELAFLHPLPVSALWGVGPVTSEKLARRGIHKVGDLAEMSESVLVGMLGGAVGRHLRALAWNRDPREVEPTRRDRSIGAQRALGRRRRDLRECCDIVVGLADKVAARLRRAGLSTRTVTVTVRFADMGRVSRSRTFDAATDTTGLLTMTAVELLTGVLAEPVGDADLPDTADQYTAAPKRPTVLGNRGVSLIGVRLSGLRPVGPEQLGLPFDGRVPAAQRELDRKIDEVHERFGNAALTRLSHLGASGGFEVLSRPTAVDAQSGGQIRDGAECEPGEAN